MNSFKEYRLRDNEKEQELYSSFKYMFEHDNNTLSAIIFGWENDRQNCPKEHLTEREEDICLSLIQWLGSPVGQSYLAMCGFKLIH